MKENNSASRPNDKIASLAPSELAAIVEQHFEREERGRDENFLKLFTKDESFLNAIGEHPRAAQIFLLFAKIANRANLLYATRQAIAEHLSISPKTVTRALAYLREKKFIDAYDDTKQTLYILNPSIVWKAYSANKNFCYFDNAAVLFAKKDLNDYLRRVPELRPFETAAARWSFEANSKRMSDRLKRKIKKPALIK